MKTFFCAYQKDVAVCPVTDQQEFVRVDASFPVMACVSYIMLEDARFSVLFSRCVRLSFG